MPDEAKLDGSEKAPKSDPPGVTINISFPEHKPEANKTVWLAAVGTALSGLAAAWGVIKPPPQPVLPPQQTPNPIVDQDHKVPLFTSLHHAPLPLVPLYNFPAQNYTLAPTDIEPLVHAFGASPETRKMFVDAVVGLVGARATAADATEGEKAISTLLDPDEDTGHRVAAAFYLGGCGKREYISPLKIASGQPDIVGTAARIGLDMFQEHVGSVPGSVRHIAPFGLDFTKK